MTAYTWVCGCGKVGTGEAAAKRHVKEDGCPLMGYPKARCLAAARARQEEEE